jgi:hypothetical protein
MDEKITLKQAYIAMFEFLKDYYYRVGQPNILGSFLSDLQFLEDGKTADPASWEDWLQVVKKVKEDKN